MEFFSEIEKILFTEDYNDKINKLSNLDFDFFNHSHQILPLKPTYESFCKVVAPKNLPRRGFSNEIKKASLIHAILHIEYSAIDLALDATYRFRNMPESFYKDWLEVANDEVRHFQMLNELLNKLGYKYGDFEVHNSLIEAGIKTNTLIERMAIVPRWLEANGLDSNENIIEKLKNYKNDEIAKKLIDILYVILEEEIPHVKKGDKWFKWCCDKENLNSEKTYFEIVSKFYKNIQKPYLNISARKEAGFSCNEIKKLARNEVEC